MLGRYAPSPTGELHVGNASTALLAWLAARSARSAFLLRIEDLDAPRTRPGAEARLLADLAWLGLDWDGSPCRQSERADVYEAAFARLRDRGHVYPCFCSRRDIASAASAPQEPGDEVRYPQSCRGIDPAVAGARVAAGDRHAWRFRVEAPGAPGWIDEVCGPQPPDLPGDFVVRRADGVAAYQLAVVVDDEATGVEQVVRGNDLLASTPRQILLQRGLGLRQPSYAHVPLWVGTDGVRLSKRHQGATVREIREAGVAAPVLVGLLAHALGLRPTDAPIPARDLVPGFSLPAVIEAPRRLVWPPDGGCRWGLSGVQDSDHRGIP